MIRHSFCIAAATALIVSGTAARQPAAQAPSGAPLLASGEKRIANIRQLTFGGENAEAYFSPDGSRLIFQSHRPPETGCDQMYTMKVYASTHLRSPGCPPQPGYERGYVWPIYPGYDIFRANADGSGVQQLTSGDGYDAEATIGRDGRIVFTSVRDGDMEIYSMNGDGSGVRRLTNRPGPDGGPFFSPDGKLIVFRGRPTQGPELADYLGLLKDGLWRPTSLEIYVMNSDGSNVRQVTSRGGANFAPYFLPDGKRIIFASNIHDQKGRDFDLYLINVDGSGLERVTWNPTFDSFPMFSPDGKRLVFASNRNAAREGDTNVFIADWIDRP
jgi:TolB protein